MIGLIGKSKISHYQCYNKLKFTLLELLDLVTALFFGQDVDIAGS
jgi:hypothetical protein